MGISKTPLGKMRTPGTGFRDIAALDKGGPVKGTWLNGGERNSDCAIVLLGAPGRDIQGLGTRTVGDALRQLTSREGLPFMCFNPRSYPGSYGNDPGDAGEYNFSGHEDDLLSCLTFVKERKKSAIIVAVRTPPSVVFGAIAAINQEAPGTVVGAVLNNPITANYIYDTLQATHGGTETSVQEAIAKGHGQKLRASIPGLPLPLIVTSATLADLKKHLTTSETRYALHGCPVHIAFGTQDKTSYPYKAIIEAALSDSSPTVTEVKGAGSIMDSKEIIAQIRPFMPKEKRPANPA